MTIARRLSAAAIVAAAAISLGGPAWADALDGSYTVTVTGTDIREHEGKHPNVKTGMTAIWVLTPCGSDCLRIDRQGGAQTVMHQQGNLWVESRSPCADTIDSDTLTVIGDCGPWGTFRSQMTKNG